MPGPQELLKELQQDNDAKKDPQKQMRKASLRLQISQDLSSSEEIDDVVERTSAQLQTGAKRNLSRLIKMSSSMENGNEVKAKSLAVKGEVRSRTWRTGGGMLSKQKKASKDIKDSIAIYEGLGSRDSKVLADLYRLRADTKALRAVDRLWKPSFLGLGTSRQQMLAAAFQLYEESLKSLDENEKKADVLYTMALCSNLMGSVRARGGVRTDEALSILQRCEDITGPAPHILNLKGNIHNSSNNLDQALENYSRVCQSFPDYLMSKWNKAALLEGKYVNLLEAQETYNELVRQADPESSLYDKAERRGKLIEVEKTQWSSIGIEYTDRSASRRKMLTDLLDVPVPRAKRETTIGKTTELRPRVVIEGKLVPSGPQNDTIPVLRIASIAIGLVPGGQVASTLLQIGLEVADASDSAGGVRQTVSVVEEEVITNQIGHVFKLSCNTLREMIEVLVRREWSALELQNGVVMMRHLAHGLPGVRATDQLFKDFEKLIEISQYGFEYTSFILKPALKGYPEQSMVETRFMRDTPDYRFLELLSSDAVNDNTVSSSPSASGLFGRSERNTASGMEEKKDVDDEQALGNR